MEPPHVVMFPLPVQAPVNSMLKLAELLCLGGLHITFVVTDHIHHRLHRHSKIHTRFQSYPGFRILSISDGLPENHPRGDKFLEVFESLRVNTKPLLKEMVERSATRVSCIIGDGVLGFAFDVANHFGIPYFSVRTISAACVWVLSSLPQLIHSAEIPFQGNDLDTPVKNVPGMEKYLRRRSQYNSRAYGLILNTFEELEAPILSEMRKVCPNIYTIGPLYAHLKTKLVASATSSPAFSNSLWEEDLFCLTWLDAQPLKSVLYVSFGSLAMVSIHQLMEFWHGLVNSSQRFLWVIRSDSVAGKDWESQIPAELSQGTKERGYIVGWAPQEEVLAHSAVGGFLTHSGWNSTLESVYEGVPMICWPFFLDQQVNSRLVEEVWKLGFDMKDVCDRGVIEKCVRKLMEVRKEEFVQSADHMAKSARRCLSEGGSSYSHLQRLIDDIKAKS